VADDRRVLVTGASGFIGRQVIDPLLGRGYEVHAVARQAADVGDVVWHTADLLAPRGVERVLERSSPTHLAHLAWCAEPGTYATDAANLDWAAATLRLVRRFAEHGGSRAVLAGTCAEYDWSVGRPCSELSTPIAPRTLYATAKDAVRRVIEAFASRNGVSAAWTRIFHVYGPYEHASKLVPSTVLALLRGTPAPLGEGRQVFDFVHVADVGAALAAILDSATEGPVNIGSGTGTSVRAVATTIGELIGRPDLLRFGTIGEAGLTSPPVVAHPRRLTEEVGWRSIRTLREGLTESVEWWRAAEVAASASP
jgi:nucleoside-diphosphate-sugar epimerase